MLPATSATRDRLCSPLELQYTRHAHVTFLLIVCGRQLAPFTRRFTLPAPMLLSSVGRPFYIYVTLGLFHADFFFILTVSGIDCRPNLGDGRDAVRNRRGTEGPRCRRPAGDPTCRRCLNSFPVGSKGVAVYSVETLHPAED